MLSVALARLETSALLSSISRFEKVRWPSTRYLCWQHVPLKPSRAVGKRCERDYRCKLQIFALRLPPRLSPIHRPEVARTGRARRKRDLQSVFRHRAIQLAIGDELKNVYGIVLPRNRA